MIHDISEIYENTPADTSLTGAESSETSGFGDRYLLTEKYLSPIPLGLSQDPNPFISGEARHVPQWHSGT